MTMPDALPDAVEAFTARLRAVPADGWHASTPCSEWDVHDLVNHVVNELRWVSPLLAGRTIAEVGDSLDGDLLGDDPAGAWDAAAAEAVAAARALGTADPAVHLSYGDSPASAYLAELASDVIVHTWDLARAAQTDDRLPPALVAYADGVLRPSFEAWRAAGAFGPSVDLPPDADAQDHLLAATGRRPSD
jgi:uncharacterized protein (TIGR03086 family)